MSNTIAGRDCPICCRPAPRTESGFVCANRHSPVLLCWPWESVEEYHALYTTDEVYHHDEALRHDPHDFWQRDTEYTNVAIQRVRFLRGVVPYLLKTYTHWIDVGTGNGIMPGVAESLLPSCLATGLEVCPSMVERAAALGRRVVGCDIATPLRDHSVAHVVSMYDVFEHMTNPHEVLDACVATIKDVNGVLVIEQPEYSAPGWARHLKPRQHPCLYSADAMRELARDHDLYEIAFYRPLGGGIAKMAHVFATR